MTNETTNQKPFDKLDLFPIEATIWERTTAEGQVFYTAQVIRKFKDDSGYRSTPSYGQREADKHVTASHWVRDRLNELNKKEAA